MKITQESESADINYYRFCEAGYSSQEWGLVCYFEVFGGEEQPKLQKQSLSVKQEEGLKKEEKIELLEEYKSSLIHHVVIGKVDVRGEIA